MTATINDHEPGAEAGELAHEHGANTAEGLAVAGERSESCFTHAPLPWIGALPNPRLGPMVVVNDGGYLVPLCTVGDLVRGCRYFWRRTLD